MERFTGREYLMIAIANHYGNGVDKLQFRDRIEWVDMHETTLEEIEYDAKDFYQFAAAVMAYRKGQGAEATGYLVGMDSTASGLQMLSVLTGCKVGAENTGVTGTKRKNIYDYCTIIMNNILDSDNEYDTADVKAALMCMFYGSIQEPINAFGDDTPELYAFYQAAGIVAPGAYQLLPLISSLQDPEALAYRCDYPDGFVANYKVKNKLNSKIEIDTLNPHITFTYRCTHNIAMDEIRFLPAWIAHGSDGYVARELVSRCNYDVNQLKEAERLLTKRLNQDIEVMSISYTYIEKMWRKHSCISMEGIEFVNLQSMSRLSEEYCKELLSLVQTTLARPSFEVITIFDEFKALPNYMNEVRQTYIDILAEIADSTLLQANLTDINKSSVEVVKLSSNLSGLIKQAEYPLS